MPRITRPEVARQFAAEYIRNGGNAHRAAVSVGYSKRYADGNSYKLVENSVVQDMIAELNAETQLEQIATVAEIKQFWTNTMNDNDAKMRDRIKCGELLMRCAGGFVPETQNNIQQIIITGGDNIAD